MKVKSISIKNFRLLQNFSVDLEDNLSLVIGKNNTGKTSLLTILDKFLNPSEKRKFTFDDFNIDFKNIVNELLNNALSLEEDYLDVGIIMRVLIEYNETDNLENISKVMMDLDPENNMVVLGYEYTLDYQHMIWLKEKFSEFKQKEEIKKAENIDYSMKDGMYFLKHNQSDFFKTRRKSIEFINSENMINEDVFIDLDKEGIPTRDIISFKYISAKREVTNREIDKTLSNQTSLIYKKTEETEEQTVAIEKFKDQLIDTDDVLTGIYDELFVDVIEKVRKFGGIKENDSTIKIESNLQHRNLLDGNTTVMYNHNGSSLPEYNNGLGYMNLISIIFEIEIILQDFKRKREEKPADINLLFIEEPEAHTHPQMQYVFIKNIKALIGNGIQREDGKNRKLHTIISTHSSHIVSESDFDDIKYLIKENQNSVIAKNLTSLKTEYDLTTEQYQFLTQYLTLSRAEIFFADKVIFIEGDTERILLPTFMRKFDFDEQKKFNYIGEIDPDLPLSSQNVSVIEVGAYSQIFEKFIEFIGVKTLIITDLDSINDANEACKVSDGTKYSNGALSHYFNKATLPELISYTIDNKSLSKDEDIWKPDADGRLCVIYQVEEIEIIPRSFEEAFLIPNREYVAANKENFKGLQNRDLLDDVTQEPYTLAERCIKKKTHFALDIIYHTDEEYTNWSIPLYFQEGLEWLKKD